MDDDVRKVVKDLFVQKIDSFSFEQVTKWVSDHIALVSSTLVMLVLEGLCDDGILERVSEDVFKWVPEGSGTPQQQLRRAITEYFDKPMTEEEQRKLHRELFRPLNAMSGL